MALVLSPYLGPVGPLPSTAGLESGPFVGNYSDGLMAALLASCAAKVKPPLEGFGRDLQPYFKPERAEPPKAKAQADSKKKGRKGAGENSPPASTGARTPVGDRAQASPRRPSKRPKSTPKATAPTRVAPTESTTQAATPAPGPRTPAPRTPAPFKEVSTGRKRAVSPTPAVSFKDFLDAAAGDLKGTKGCAGPSYVRSPPPTELPLPSGRLMTLLESA